MTRASCSKRIGTVVLKKDNFGDLLTADHKVLSEGCESRNSHRYVAVQHLATQWLQCYPCKAKTSQEFQKVLQKFLEPTRKPKVIYTDNSSEFGNSCGVFLEPLQVNTTQIGKIQYTHKYSTYIVSSLFIKLHIFVSQNNFIHVSCLIVSRT